MTAVPATDSAMAPASSSPPSVAYVATVASPVHAAAMSPVRAASLASRACSASAVSDIAR